jgi:hypothetical protein
MKKACLVVICLSIASAASAAIGFVPSKTTVAMGETINIKLIADGLCYGFVIGAVNDGNKGGMVSNLSFGTGMTVIDGGYIDNTPDMLFDTVAAFADPAVAAGNVLFSFNYTADSILGQVTIAPIPWVPGDPIIIQSTGSIYPPPGDTQGIAGCTITVVPEPVTVALLGLGGLFLRRRIR